MLQDTGVERAVASGRRAWLRVFLVGLLLWVATVVVILATRNPNLIPTMVLLGSFLVPVTFITWAFEHRDTGEITASLVFTTFVAGGVLGVLAASLLETYLLHPSPWLFLGVGLIEEGAKLAVLMFFTRHLHTKSVRDGMILGATVGFGFAAFESAGYAFTALFTVHGLSLMNVVETELLRGLLTPVGHGLWTAILGGVLFSSSGRGHFTITGRLILAYLGVSVLHALWDSMHNIALVLTLVLTQSHYVASPQGWLVQPSHEQLVLFPIIDWGGLAVVSAIGIGWLVTLWRPGPRSYRVGWRIPTTRTIGS